MSTTPDTDMTTHPADETWEQLALGELTDAERARVVAHAAGCGSCGRLWLGLRAVDAGARGFDPAVAALPAIEVPAEDPGEAPGIRGDTSSASAPPPPIAVSDELARHERRKRQQRRSRAFLAGGAVAIAAAAAILLWPGRGRDDTPIGDDVVRGGSDVAPITVTPTGTLAAGPASLAWSPVPGATSYRVAIFTDDGKPVGAAFEVASPPATTPALAAGRYRWRVEALAKSAVIARSPYVPLAVGP
jgi:hypothetical protein